MSNVCFLPVIAMKKLKDYLIILVFEPKYVEETSLSSKVLVKQMDQSLTQVYVFDAFLSRGHYTKFRSVENRNYMYSLSIKRIRSLNECNLSNM